MSNKHPFLTLTAIMRQNNGERPDTFWAFRRPGRDGKEQLIPVEQSTYYRIWDTYRDRVADIDGSVVAFDPDRPIGWDDVMGEGRGQ